MNKQIAILCIILLSACTRNETDMYSPVQTEYELSTSQSKVQWYGNLLNIIKHQGIINFQRGSIVVSENQIVGGEIVIDMSTIQPMIDESLPDENLTELLKEHLTSKDFFDLGEYPRAIFTIHGSNNEQIFGELNLHGISRLDTIDIVLFNIKDNQITGSGSLNFTGDDYDLSYKHESRDMIVSFIVDTELSVFAEIQEPKPNELPN